LLAQAHVLQPLIAAISLAYLKRLADAGVGPDCVLGHSLGEITALAAAGVVTDTDAVRIAVCRGRLMDDVARKTAGGMLAALFIPFETITALLDELNAADRIVVANDNADDQVVLSGDNEMLDRFSALVRDRRLGRTARVNVIGPWHSPYMRQARMVYEAWVAPVEFRAPVVPVILSSTARAETDPACIKQLSVNQLTEPVHWRQSMETLKRRDIDTLIEIGPGRVLAGLARVNGFRGAKIFSVNNLQGVGRALEELNKSEVAETAGT
jgi:[acyl-carrier-protein] S-malonyltransferase